MDREEQSETMPDRLGKLRPVFTALIGLVFSAALLMIGGRWNWIEGWTVSGIFIAYLVGTGLWIARHMPGLSSERVRAIARPGSLHEQVILIWVGAAHVALIVVAALDGGRYRWSRVPVGVEVVGFALLGIYILLNLWVMFSNPFLSAVARVQDDRGHRVVASGPYRVIRHPMYAAICLMGIAVPLALGSWWALIPGGLLILTFIYRTWQEDWFLIAGLPGYAEYAQQTRYRLLPGIW
ncbi:MAG: isoprenylcysteine carboxylmethyltransferase family protein [Anaerolineae bacterium]|nr:isoprenylcysteine carboxylmethyltransferase family protein [Anaerolineae bacterium]